LPINGGDGAVAKIAPPLPGGDPRPVRRGFGGIWQVTVRVLWVLVAITLVFAVLAIEGHRTRDVDSRWVQHSIEVKAQLGRLDALARDLAQGQQGYWLTGNAHFLALCAQALADMSGAIRSVARLVADNPAQAASAAHLQTLVAAKVTAAVRPGLPGDPALGAPAPGTGEARNAQRLTDQIRAEVDAMTTAEDQLLLVRQQVLFVRERTQRELMAGLIVVDVALLGGLTLLIRRSQTSRRTADVRTDEANTRTERAEAHGEQAIRASELRYRRLFEAAQDGILILDGDSGEVVDANPFMLEMLGYAQDELRGRKLWEIGPLQGAAASKVAFAALQRSDRIRSEGLLLETKAGRQIEVECIGSAYRAEDKRLIQCNFRDLTERRKAEQQLDLLNTCIANLNDIVMVTEADAVVPAGRRILFVNRAFERITGFTFQEAVSRPPWFLQGPKTDPQVLAEIHDALSQYRPIRRQLLNYHKDGGEYWIDLDIVPIFDAAGTCTCFAAIQRDITQERRNAESLSLFRNLMDCSPDAIEVIDRHSGRLLDVNATACQRLGYTRTEMLSLHLADIADETAAGPKAPAPAAAQTVWPTGFKMFEGRRRRKDGSTFPVEVNVQSIELNRGYVIAIVRDITERRRTEARGRRLIESNAQGVFFWHHTGRITDANDAFLRIVGYSREDLAAGRLDWQAISPPEYAEIDRRAVEQTAARGSCEPYEKEYFRKDGSRIPVLVGAAIFEDTADEGICFVVDLTEAKKLEQRYFRAQRMESIGTLAGGIAHDLNNILAPIMMSIGILERTATDPQARRMLETIASSAQRGADIVRQVLSFARGVEGRRVEVAPRALLVEFEQIIKSTFPKDIRLQFAVADDAWMILGDPTQVHQILLNLCVNARDAMPQGGLLTVTAGNRTVLGTESATQVPIVPGRYVSLRVTDSGTGMPPAVIEKVFDPFFTTKGLHEGTGLGLSTVIAIVKSHAGTIDVTSTVGQGSTFTVLLPAVGEDRAEPADASAPAAMPRGHDELVLVVDDDAAILTVTRQTLEAFGYRALTATDGAEAVSIYAQRRPEIAVVLTDLSMPIMDGAATIRALRRINPAVKIIAASGRSVPTVPANDSNEGVGHVLTKPYATGALLTVLRAILDQA
jgi:PAS domain S-box-containing protein